MYLIRFCIMTTPADGETAGTTARRTTRRRTATLERLLDGAREVFAEVGFQAATIEEVCARAGFTRGAFYSSFRTKDELFLALHRREIGRIMDDLASWLEGIENESSPTEAAVERYLSSFTVDRTWHLVHAEFTLHAMRDADAAAALVDHADVLVAELGGLIERAVAATGCRLTAGADDVARLVIAVHNGTVEHALLRDDLPDAARLERWFIPVLLQSVSAPHDAHPHPTAAAGS